ncbi:MAG: hypothetical protein U0572_11135 [Phycisphaerales bacterium]
MHGRERSVATIEPRDFQCAARRLVVALSAAMVLLIGGCGGFSSERPKVRELSLVDFASATPEHPGAAPSFYGDLPSMDVREADLAGDDPEVADAALLPEGEPMNAMALPRVEGSSAQRWMVDGLVGQINGRPVFADEFLEPLASKLQQLAAQTNRADARRQMIGLIHDRFQAFVDSELVISEAESQLTPEQQQGLFAWLRSIQEEEIASRGGTRAEANASLEQDLGMPLEEFLQQRRDQGLSGYLLNRKVAPRTIVSWRDVERFYRQNQAAINPPPTVRVGRIAFSKARQQAKIEKAKAMFAAQATFLEVAKATEAERGGVWFVFELAPGKTLQQTIDENKDLAPALKERLRLLTPGGPVDVVETDATITWFTILDVTEHPQRSIFDPELQIAIKEQLKAARQSVEQARYIGKLRSRWISDDISQIEERLVIIAFARYWR